MARDCSVTALRSPPSNSVCASDAPTDHIKLGPDGRFATEVLCEAPDPPRLSTGKYAARATPICAFASSTRRSAAAIFGRRSSNCDGTPAGIATGLIVVALGSMVNEDAV